MKVEPQKEVTESVGENAKKVVVSGVTKSVRRKSSLSIKNRKLHKQEQNEVLKKEALTGEARNDFSQALLRNKWSQLARNFQKEGKESLYVTLTKHQPEVGNNFLVTFLIDSQVQLLELNDLKADILSFLRKELQNYGIQLEFKMNQNIAVKRHKTSKERYEKMVKKNPALELFRKKLNMDIEYD